MSTFCDLKKTIKVTNYWWALMYFWQWRTEQPSVLLCCSWKWIQKAIWCWRSTGFNFKTIVWKSKVLLSSHWTWSYLLFFPTSALIEEWEKCQGPTLHTRTEVRWIISITINLKVANVTMWHDSLLYSTKSCVFSPLHPECSRSRPAGSLCTAWFSLSSRETWTGDWWMTCGILGPPPAAPEEKIHACLWATCAKPPWLEHFTKWTQEIVFVRGQWFRIVVENKVRQNLA